MKELDFSVGKEELKTLKKETKEIIELLKQGVKKTGINADVFVGGSLAKGTLAKSEDYDVDIFVRFNWKYEDLSKYLEKIVQGVKKEGWKIDKLHGSRDYFRIFRDKKITFEIIPVLRIRKPREARNVTDLSYFHVNYVKRNLKAGMKNEIVLAKKFCKANGFYGAESYINGFSGYGLECLIISYGKFEKMLRALVKVKERIILDPAKLYKKKDDVLFEMNESKLDSPIILVDPTWKERNVLAALSHETFHKFQKIAGEYLRKPLPKYFESKKLNVEELRRRKGEFVHVVLETDRQEGDIAGTKMKKFSRFLESEIRKYFEIVKREFVYTGGGKADFFLLLRSRRKITRLGPSLEMKEDAKRFRKKNKNVFEKNGLLHALINVDFSAREFIRKMDKKRMREMGIVGMRVG